MLTDDVFYQSRKHFHTMEEGFDYAAQRYCFWAARHQVTKQQISVEPDLLGYFFHIKMWALREAETDV